MTCGVPSAPAVARWPTRCTSRKRRASAVQLDVAHLRSGELRLRLRDDLAVARFIARREVEDVEATNSCGTRERAGLARRQVVAAGRLIDVLLEEGGLAEEQVRVRCQPHDRRRVGTREERVDHVRDLLPGGDGEQLVAQPSEWPA